VEQFFWQDFCDNYLEIVKKRVYQGEGNAKLSAQYTLYKSLLAIIKMTAPIMPFITEEIYQEYFKKTEKTKSIHISKWPETEEIKKQKKETWTILLDTLSRIRQEKSKNQKAMNSEISMIIPPETYKELKPLLKDLKSVTNSSDIREGKFSVEFND
jgi:valyl-tRNA synthetase